MLNSFEELCITLAVAGNSFTWELNPHGGAYIYIYIYIHTPTRGLSTRMGNLPATTYAEIQSSSRELSTLVTDNVYVKSYTPKLPSFTLRMSIARRSGKIPELRKISWFRSRFEESRKFNHTDELGYKTVCGWRSIYIYIYIICCICLGLMSILISTAETIASSCFGVYSSPLPWVWCNTRSNLYVWAFTHAAEGSAKNCLTL